ncbi:MAG: Xaa-Pro peptidase family protein [Treponema sp.]|nr:Xaa-Pro peptidase family protein [Treponema sp.]
MTDLNSIYKARREKIYDYLKEQNISAAVFEDSEDRRDVSIRYLTGHPSDAVLVLLADRRCILIPWDENLAAMKAHADKVIPYTEYGRSNIAAVKQTLSSFSGDSIPNVAISPLTPHALYEKYVTALHGWNVECKENSVHKKVEELRAIKDSYEIECTRKACSITDGMTEYIIKHLSDGSLKTESDVALYAEKELRASGCERTSFDTLAAGPKRSFAIHAFPGYTNGNWGTEGLSILDYGVCYEGYASDCTITIAKGKLSAQQEQLLDLVQKAADECIKLYTPEHCISEAVNKADDIFAEAGLSMPHGLGHGTGLEIHESPFVSKRTEKQIKFMPGNIITLEPGLYDAKLGGVRLENDVLITSQGNEVLTHSKIFRL